MNPISRFISISNRHSRWREATRPIADSVVLIVAHSARRLAQAASRVGLRPVTIDAFADRDTRTVAHCIRIPLLQCGFEHYPFEAALHAVRRRFGRVPAVFGGGLEFETRQLRALHQSFDLRGNPPAVMETITRPKRFFALLRDLDIAHPPTVLSADARMPGGVWLQKRAASSGGCQVRSGERSTFSCPDGYLQREVFGPSLAMLFLAVDGTAQVVGWSCHFRSHSAIAGQVSGCCAIDPPQPALRRQMTETVQRLTDALHLRGLGGADFVIDGDGRALLIDLNARPTASLDLHDPSGKLFAAHLAGTSIERPPPGWLPKRAFATVFSPLEANFGGRRWPAWVSDIPCGRVAAGEPLCSVYAQASRPDAAIANAIGRAEEIAEAVFR